MKTPHSTLLWLLLALASAIGATARNNWTDKSPHKTEFITVNSVRLHYLDWGGKGETILFLHGSGRTRAYTALFGVSTQDFFNPIQGDPSLLAGIATLARVAAWGGGFPIKVNGEVVGAIGLSGAPAVQNDVDCAMAALTLVPDARRLTNLQAIPNLRRVVPRRTDAPLSVVPPQC